MTDEIAMKGISEPQEGQLFVITGPSGSGKNTIIEMVRKDLKGLGYSISHTTRAPRKDELDGVHYYFVGKKQFEKMIQAQEFAEWAVVYDQLYGTSISSVRSAQVSGKDVLLDLDLQGARQIKKRFPDSTSIFIAPPSLQILRERLEKRSSHDGTNIDLRMNEAVQEIRECRNFDFLIVNDDLRQAVREVQAVIVAVKAQTKLRLPSVEKMFNI
ncbi:MAG: guanylate kinase [Deltaproteobacteria bacterium]|nr:MAG: guanylate kinase [Deltaproteobacteria bacterium]